jgi:hypothetical protein
LIHYAALCSKMTEGAWLLPRLLAL